MNYGEYYTSKEHNYIGENKSFPAEIYKKPFEENSLGRETADSGNEITTLQKKNKRSKSNADGSKKNLIDKVFGSVKSIATTATVAVTAIVVSNTVMANTVNAELKDIDVGTNYVEYELEIDDLSAEDDCFIILSASGETISETEINENGAFEARIEDLKPEWEYTLSVVSRDGILGDIVRFKHKFQTLKHEEYDPNPPPEDNSTEDNPSQNVAPPDTYDGNYEIPSISGATVDWGAKQILLPIVFENVDARYLYRITVTDKAGNLIGITEGNESKNAVINVLDEIDIYYLAFEIYGIGTSEERLIISHDLGMLDVLRPSADVTGITVIGENLVRVDFVHLNTEALTLRIGYADDNYEDLALTPAEISRGYAEIRVPATTAKVTVTPIVVLDGLNLVQTEFEKEFMGELELAVFVNLSDDLRYIDLYVKAITNGATYIYLDSSDASLTGTYEVWDGMASVHYDNRMQMSFTAYLTDEVGTKLSDEVQISLDTTAPETKPDYVLNYTNPNNVAVTYNDDGTINAYFNTNFECADEAYYSLIRLGQHAVRTRNPMVSFKNLPNETYSLQYCLCYERDGIEYSVMSVTPSGTVNEAYHYGAYAQMNTKLAENTFVVSLDEYHNLDLSSLRLVSSSGEEIIISESDFVSDGVGGYILTVTFEDVPEYVTVYATVCPDPSAFDFIEDYEGSIYVPYEAEIYPY